MQGADVCMLFLKDLVQYQYYLHVPYHFITTSLYLKFLRIVQSSRGFLGVVGPRGR